MSYKGPGKKEQSFETMSDSTTLSTAKSGQTQSSNATSSSPNQASVTTRLVLCGNPGVGKSTLLNSLTNSSHFASGSTIGAGLTQRADIFTVDGIEYADTPGLGDVQRGHTAAEQISGVLNAPHRGVIVLFVITLGEAGGIKPADVQTVRSVCEALQRADVDMRGRVAVVVNKCASAVSGDRAYLRQVGIALGQTWGVANVLTLPVEEGAAGRVNARLKNVHLVRKLIDSIEPFAIKEGARVSIVYKNVVHEARRARVLQNDVVAMRSAVDSARREKKRSGFLYVMVTVGFAFGLFKIFRLLAKEEQ